MNAEQEKIFDQHVSHCTDKNGEYVPYVSSVREVIDEILAASTPEPGNHCIQAGCDDRAIFCPKHARETGRAWGKITLDEPPPPVDVEREAEKWANTVHDEVLLDIEEDGIREAVYAKLKEAYRTLAGASRPRLADEELLRIVQTALSGGHTGETAGMIVARAVRDACEGRKG